MDPFYWIHESLRFGRICAKKHPGLAWTLPTVVSFGVGLVFMEFTNPSSQTTITVPTAAAKAPVAWKHGQQSVDPYDPQVVAAATAPKRHKTWQAQYIQDMLDGLKHKTREEKLDDAFYALDQLYLKKKE
jgi:hypothetical protein